MATVELPRRAAESDIDGTGVSAAATGEGDQRNERYEASPAVSPQARHEMIAIAAYYFAEVRGFVAGLELDDWLRAEADIDAQLGQPSGVDSRSAKQTA